MKPQYTTYTNYLKSIPETGQHILAQQTDDQILVYQAYNPAIADFAIKNQYLGGSHFKYSRMSWIKPNFLWMMFRCGWASKENQERVLGIWMDKTDFEKILSEAVYSSFKSHLYDNHEHWKSELASKNVRLQWDPDHDIYGAKQERRAIQLGMKEAMLEDFGKKMINKIVDMTPFVLEQKKKIDAKALDELLVPKESIFLPEHDALSNHLEISIK